MAQSRMSNFFLSKKRSQEANPSKKRKIELTEPEPSKVLTAESTFLCDAKTVKLESPAMPPAAVSVKATATATGSTAPVKTTSRTKQKATTRSTRSRASARQKGDLVGQVKIQDAFAKSSGTVSDTDASDDVDLPSTDTGNGSTNVAEEITSQWDEHDGPKTPKRKVRPCDGLQLLEDGCIETRRTHRKAKRSNESSTTPNKVQDDVREKEKTSRRKSLAQSFQKLASSVTNIEQKISDGSSKDVQTADKIPTLEKDCGNRKAIATKQLLPSDEDIIRTLSVEQAVPISPLPVTPQKSSQSRAPPISVTSPKLKASMEKCKQLQEDSSILSAGSSARSRKVPPTGKMVAPEVLRDRLAKCGKLDALKSKLAEMNSTLKAVKKIQADNSVAQEPLMSKADGVKASKNAEVAAAAEVKPSPAYERYEHLAREGPPTLSLPGKYQRLLQTFQGTDTVVSMLFNRHEIITFTKLQAAVQSITRKNFEQKTLGQIKTVFPAAYDLRQEKGLPSFGTKTSGYQLTVQPNLEGMEKDGKNVNCDGRLTMSANAMLKRKRIFHNTLVDLTKDHHADFLARLNPALTVPASKLTRWHPKFGLDSVPDIQPSELPVPPTALYQTAQQVLVASRGKLPARVEQAMEKVAKQSESSQPPPKGPSAVESKPASVSGAPDKASTSSAYKGIPVALLEKIRAKEAKKMQAALTRDPQEDRKTAMMGRLPSLIRSLRTFYVTEKKPTLPMVTVVEKLADSYATSISTAGVESHLKLLQELAPKWLQVIEIPRGKYVKVDKNMDITKIIADITNLANSRK